MSKAKKSYIAAPQVPPGQSERLAMILEVLAGSRSVSEAARTLGISRNHFQTLLHRGLGALVESITPHSAGRPAKPQQVSVLEVENERLKRENSRLQEKVEMTDRLLNAASGLLQGRIRPSRVGRTRRRTAAADDDKAESEPARRLRALDRMRHAGITAAFAAAIAGVHPSTVRRWRRRERHGCALRERRGRAPIAPQLAHEASLIVRRLHGQVGAASLARSVPGLSRRQAACIKARTLTDVERERKAQARRVCIAVPGIVRGMDGMFLRTSEGPAHALIAADAAIGYRTAVLVGKRYDAQLVARTLERDIAANGAPLVYRFDRAMAHNAHAVRELLEHNGVLVLHGPPRYPQFYGQLERQNREHRAWIDEELADLHMDQVESRLAEMIAAINGLWRRRLLGWRTPAEAWQSRARIEVNRSKLREEVNERAARIARHPQLRGKPADLAQRLAIEQAFQQRGYLRQIVGGWC